MAIIQGLIAVIGRSAGKVINTVFGWATVLLFGKVPKDRQIYVSVMTFGSVIWLIALAGIAFPSFGAFLLAFVPLPRWVDRTWVRLAMLFAAAVIPLVVGLVSLKLLIGENQPRTSGDRAKMVVKGYPYTLGLALTLIIMTLLAPVMKIRSMAKRWTNEHVPVVIEPEDYNSVVNDVQRAMEQGDVRTKRERASWMIRYPTRVVTFLAGGAVKNLVAENLTMLKGEKVEILVQPADIIISGKELDAAHARAVLAEYLVFSKAYLTWDKEANQMEDRMNRIWSRISQASGTADYILAASRLRSVQADIRLAQLPYEEWEVLFREVLLIERELLKVAADIPEREKRKTA